MWPNPQGPDDRVDDLKDMKSVPLVPLAEVPDDDVVRVIGRVEGRIRRSPRRSAGGRAPTTRRSSELGANADQQPDLQSVDKALALLREALQVLSG